MQSQWTSRIVGKYTKIHQGAHQYQTLLQLLTSTKVKTLMFVFRSICQNYSVNCLDSSESKANGIKIDESMTTSETHSHITLVLFLNTLPSARQPFLFHQTSFPNATVKEMGGLHSRMQIFHNQPTTPPHPTASPRITYT